MEGRICARFSRLLNWKFDACVVEDSSAKVHGFITDLTRRSVVPGQPRIIQRCRSVKDHSGGEGGSSSCGVDAEHCASRCQVHRESNLGCVHDVLQLEHSRYEAQDRAERLCSSHFSRTNWHKQRGFGAAQVNCPASRFVRTRTSQPRRAKTPWQRPSMKSSRQDLCQCGENTSREPVGRCVKRAVWQRTCRVNLLLVVPEAN